MASPSRRAKRRHNPGAPARSVAVSRSSDETATYPVHVLGVRRAIAVSGSRHQRIAKVAARQRGQLSRSQLLTIGVPDRAIYRLAAQGHLIRVRRGVYAVGHIAPTPLAEETAALLACGPDAVLSHLTAARMRSILRHDDDSIHVAIAHRHGPAPPGIHVHRTSTLSPGDIQVRDGLPTTSTARTLLDLAAVLDRRDLEWAVDEAVQQRIVTVRALRAVAQRGVGSRGSGALRRAVKRHRPSGVTKSRAEKRFRALLRAAGLPEPLRNVRLHGFEVDCYWPDSRLVVEVDGYRFHSTRPKFEHDSRKGADLVAAGLSVMRVTWYQMRDEPFAVVARTAQALVPAA